MSHFNGIGKTSLLVAAMRAFESKLSDAEGRLFIDPFAEELAGPEGFIYSIKPSRQLENNRPFLFGPDISMIE